MAIASEKFVNLIGERIGKKADENLPAIQGMEGKKIKAGKGKIGLNKKEGENDAKKGGVKPEKETGEKGGEKIGGGAGKGNQANIAFSPAEIELINGDRFGPAKDER